VVPFCILCITNTLQQYKQTIGKYHHEMIFIVVTIFKRHYNNIQVELKQCHIISDDSPYVMMVGLCACFGLAFSSPETYGQKNRPNQATRLSTSRCGSLFQFAFGNKWSRSATSSVRALFDPKVQLTYIFWRCLSLNNLLILAYI